MATGDILLNRTVVIARSNIGVASRAFGPVALPAALGYVRLDIDMTDSTQVGQDMSFVVEISPDGGVSFPYKITGSFAGGPPGPRAVPPLISTDQFLIPEAGNPNRVARGQVNFTGAPRSIEIGLTGLSA